MRKEGSISVSSNFTILISKRVLDKIKEKLGYDVKYCEVYFSVNPRIIVLEFKKEKTEDSYSISRIGEVGVSLIVKVLGLFPSTSARHFEIVGNRLIIYWDEIVPISEVELYKLHKTIRLPTILSRNVIRGYKYLYLPNPVASQVSPKYKYCELYYTVEPVRTILIRFKKYKTEPYDLAVIRLGGTIQIDAHKLLELLKLETYTTAIAYRFISDKELLIYWDGIVPYNKLKFIPYKFYDVFVKVRKDKESIYLSSELVRMIPSPYVKSVLISKKHKIMLIEFTDKPEEAVRKISDRRLYVSKEIRELGLKEDQVSRDVEIFDNKLVIYW